MKILKIYGAALSYLNLTNDDFRKHRRSTVIGALAGAFICGAVGFGLAYYMLGFPNVGEVAGQRAACTIACVVVFVAIGAVVGAVWTVAFSVSTIKPTVAITYVCAFVGAVITGVVIAPATARDPVSAIGRALIGTLLGASIGATIGAIGFRDAGMVRGFGVSPMGGGLLAAVLFTFAAAVGITLPALLTGYPVGLLISFVLGKGSDSDIVAYGVLGWFFAVLVNIVFHLVVYAVLIPYYED